MAALRFLDLTDVSGFPTAKLRQLAVSRGAERVEVVKRIVREAYDFLEQDAPNRRPPPTPSWRKASMTTFS
jgi:hypothetical protein